LLGRIISNGGRQLLLDYRRIANEANELEQNIGELENVLLAKSGELDQAIDDQERTGSHPMPLPLPKEKVSVVLSK
jgi:hypothetical protein